MKLEAERCGCKSVCSSEEEGRAENSWRQRRVTFGGARRSSCPGAGSYRRCVKAPIPRILINGFMVGMNAVRDQRAGNKHYDFLQAAANVAGGLDRPLPRRLRAEKAPLDRLPWAGSSLCQPKSENPGNLRAQSPFTAKREQSSARSAPPSRREQTSSS